MASSFKHLVQNFFYIFPNGKTVWFYYHASLHWGVVGQVSGGNYIKIPPREVRDALRDFNLHFLVFVSFHFIIFLSIYSIVNVRAKRIFYARLSQVFYNDFEHLVKDTKTTTFLFARIRK